MITNTDPDLLDTKTHRKNIEKARGTTVKVRRDEDDSWSTKTAEIIDYHPPFVWELSRSIYGSEYHIDNNVRTLGGRRLAVMV